MGTGSIAMGVGTSFFPPKADKKKIIPLGNSTSKLRQGKKGYLSITGDDEHDSNPQKNVDNRSPSLDDSFRESVLKFKQKKQ